MNLSVRSHSATSCTFVSPESDSVTSFKVHFMRHFHLRLRWEVIAVQYGLQARFTPHFFIVSWAGDRITIAGDHGDPAGIGAPGDENLYYLARREYEDISAAMRELIKTDCYLKRHFAEQFQWAEAREISA